MADSQWSTVAVDETHMLKLGVPLAACLAAGTVVYLQGDLGAGKTTLVRGIVQSLGHRGAVKSPTYTLVEPYELGNLKVFHFDLYRLGDPEELEFIGIRDYFAEDSLALIEWPERGMGFLPPADLVVRIEREGTGRRLLFAACSGRGLEIVQGLAVLAGKSGVQ